MIQFQSLGHIYPTKVKSFTVLIIVYVRIHYVLITENPESTLQDTDPAIEAMYAVIPKEHLEQKRKKNQIRIQQYDDIDLFPLESRTEFESDGSHLQVSVTMEEEYSRLCHVGPRMNQTKKHTQHHSSSEQLVHDAGKRESVRLFAANANDDHSYSKVPCSTPKLVVPNIMGNGTDAPHNVDGVYTTSTEASQHAFTVSSGELTKHTQHLYHYCFCRGREFTQPRTIPECAHFGYAGPTKRWDNGVKSRCLL